MLKAVLDACNGLLWHDDNQIVALTGLVQYGSKEGCLVVEVKKIA
jgi:Holliday junction resolvase RusA-like endonuclease